MSNNEKNYFGNKNTNLNIHVNESWQCGVPPSPKLSQKQLYKLAKETSYKLHKELITPDFHEFGNFDNYIENVYVVVLK